MICPSPQPSPTCPSGRQAPNVVGEGAERSEAGEGWGEGKFIRMCRICSAAREATTKKERRIAAPLRLKERLT